jgi:hypothetical protein
MRYATLFGGLCLAFFNLTAQAEADPAKALPDIKALAADPTLVEAVKAQNAQNLSMEFIQKLDEKWIAAAGKLPEAEAQMSNKAAKVLKAAEKAKPYYKECILTDNKGANVAISELTSDYWQGDEPKFSNAFADGKGKDYIARPKKDASTGQVIAQVSVPVMDGGKAIGTLTVGVDLTTLP